MDVWIILVAAPVGARWVGSTFSDNAVYSFLSNMDLFALATSRMS